MKNFIYKLSGTKNIYVNTLILSVLLFIFTTLLLFIGEAIVNPDVINNASFNLID